MTIPNVSIGGCLYQQPLRGILRPKDPRRSSHLYKRKTVENFVIQKQQGNLPFAAYRNPSGYRPSGCIPCQQQYVIDYRHHTSSRWRAYNELIDINL